MAFMVLCKHITHVEFFLYSEPMEEFPLNLKQAIFTTAAINIRLVHIPTTMLP